MNRRVGFILLAFFLIYASGRTQNESATVQDPLGSTFFMGNREAVRAKLAPGSCFVVFSGGYQPFGADLTQQPLFFSLPEYYYLTGLKLPESVLVLFPEPYTFDEKQYSEILFADEQDDFESLKKRSGVEVVLDLKKWRKFCINHLPGSDFTTVHSIFSPFLDDLGWAPSAQRTLLADFNSAVYPGLIFDGRSQGLYQKILASQEKDWDRTLASIGAFVEYFPRLRRDPILDRALRVTNMEQLKEVQAYVKGIRLDVVTMEMEMRKLRSKKSTAEIKLIKALTTLNVDALKEGIKFCAPGKVESAVEAVIELTMQNKGGVPAVPTAVSQGQPLLPAHPRWVPHALTDGEVRILDAGVKANGYQSRITRTVPVSGTFTADQKKVYDILAQTQRKIIETCKPGAYIKDLTKIYDVELEKPLLKAGVAKNAKTLSRIRRLEGYHPIGLEQIDDPDYPPLAAGMVIVVETGIYFNDNNQAGKNWRNSAYELRDMVVITESGAEWLSRGVPLGAAEIEALVKQSSRFD